MTVPPPYDGYQPDYASYPPGYPVGYPAGYPYPPPARTNGMAIASLVCAFLFAPLGVVFGHISLSQIKRSGEQGRGMAIAGLIIGYMLTALSVLLVVLAVLFTMAVVTSVDDLQRQDRYSASPGSAEPLPAFAPPQNLGANCQYPATTEAAVKPAKPPRTGTVPTDPATVSAGIVTNRGSIGLKLANAKAPCTVNNFASLAEQGFFDGTQCHRLTTGDLSMLQCGDPSGTGTGGPGYRFPNEYPTNQYRLSDPAVQRPVVYPRGTVAMANAGSGTNGSQFFLVYEDSLLPPTYTVFGTVDNTGLDTLDAIAADGVADGSNDGKPATPVTIKSASVD
ncbi:peptidyl-prolyl cis-trans isomerase B (cyclophilin B) [Mycobacterium frederiksbergense]|uniref:Peptidyl-prolyl cis-trans isomerase B (Cyclophilin B) n=1 Tax=Mycolicibacterium frederiksbergense TaxID=117567 RepID=A0ABT6KSC7_9MYCO|nr:peptidylprolyl isomerase [Mycolicibacterium frederiksbergense]MDH6193642.1 peptidyl-prolyl cis-trans isomerase B (cyclophilin B) [Mycolicibacterium frederiksbergense]